MVKNSSNRRIFTLNCKGRIVTLDKPQVMGIINVTPDSFYEGSRFTTHSGILRQFERLLNDGADIIDVGGQSTRPGSELVPQEEELARVIPLMKILAKEFPEALISIDTFYSKVAREAVDHGASMVNDVSGGSIDVEMFAVVAGLNVPYVCMHAQGSPQTMQEKPVYENVTREVLDFLIQRTATCRAAGIKDIIIDPGFGFGKTIRHNFELLKNLSVFQILGCPVLLGLSRKSTIYKTLNSSAENALNGTTVLNTIGVLNGADILRVHDVKEALEIILLYEAYNES